MRKLSHRHLRNQALQAITDLQWIADNATAIADRANADLDEGLRGRSYDGDGRGGSELTQPEAHLERRLHTHDGQVHIDTDRIAEQITRLNGTITLTADTASAARTIAGDLTTSTTTDDRTAQSTIAKPAGGRGTCENCSRWCSGDRNDRLITPVTSDEHRDGAIAQCPTCLRYWNRNRELRPPRLWGNDNEGDTAA